MITIALVAGMLLVSFWYMVARPITAAVERRLESS